MTIFLAAEDCLLNIAHKAERTKWLGPLIKALFLFTRLYPCDLNLSQRPCLQLLSHWGWGFKSKLWGHPYLLSPQWGAAERIQKWKSKGERGRKTSLQSAQSKTGNYFPKRPKFCRAWLAPAKMRPSCCPSSVPFVLVATTEPGLQWLVKWAFLQSLRTYFWFIAPQWKLFHQLTGIQKQKA